MLETAGDTCWKRGMQVFRSFPARCGQAALSGAIYALAFPPLGWRWLVLPGLLGLLFALRDQQGTRARTIGFIHGICVYAVGLSWLFHLFGGVSIPLWCVLAAFTALFAEMQSRAVRSGITCWKLVAFTTLNWCGWEFIRAELFPLKFPWMTPGLAIGPNALLPWIGVYGVGAVVMSGVMLAFMRKWKSALTVFTCVLLATFAFPRIQSPADGDPRAVKVGALQMEGVSLTDFIKGTRQLPGDVRYVVWPEYAVPFDLRKSERDWKLVQDLCRERKITLTLGTQNRSSDTEWRNIALTLDASGVRGEHNKVHTVHMFDDGIAGTTALPIETEHGKIGTPVCFDCDYEGVVRRMTAAGAEMFMVPIMDAESWTARQHDQHAELFRIRACENGRWMFVCATSGVSQLIDPHGHVHSRLGAMKQGPLIGNIRRENGLTIYTRVGWLVPWIMLAVAIMMWMTLVLRPKKRDDA
jgi:apolipoprotein N-acyltransferase